MFISTRCVHGDTTCPCIYCSHVPFVLNLYSCRSSNYYNFLKSFPPPLPLFSYHQRVYIISTSQCLHSTNITVSPIAHYHRVYNVSILLSPPCLHSSSNTVFSFFLLYNGPIPATLQRFPSPAFKILLSRRKLYMYPFFHYLHPSVLPVNACTISPIISMPLFSHYIHAPITTKNLPPCLSMTMILLSTDIFVTPFYFYLTLSNGIM